MSRSIRTSATGANPTNSKPQPSTISYAERAKLSKTQGKLDPLSTDNNDKSSPTKGFDKDKLKVGEVTNKSNDIPNVILPKLEKKPSELKVIFGFHDLKPENLPSLSFTSPKYYDLNKISFGNKLEKIKISDNVKITCLKNGFRHNEFTPKANGPSAPGYYSKHTSNNHYDNIPHFVPNTSYPHPSSLSNSHTSPYTKQGFTPSGANTFQPGHYPQFQQHSPNQQWGGNKPMYSSTQLPNHSPNSQAGYNPHSRGREKPGPQNSSGVYQPNLSPNNSGPNWTPPYYHGYPTPSFDPNFQHYGNFVPPYQVMPSHTGMTPSNPSLTPHLNTNATPFVPLKTSKAIKIINPNTNVEVKPPGSSSSPSTTKETSGTSNTTTIPVTSSAIRISKPSVSTTPAPETSAEKSNSTPSSVELKQPESKSEDLAKDTSANKPEDELKHVKEDKPSATSSFKVSDVSKTELKSDDKKTGQITENEVETKDTNIDSSTKDLSATQESSKISIKDEFLKPKDKTDEEKIAKSVDEIKPKLDGSLKDSKGNDMKSIKESTLITEGLTDQIKPKDIPSENKVDLDEQPSTKEKETSGDIAKKISPEKELKDDSSKDLLKENGIDKIEDEDDELKVDEPTIIAVKTETLILTKPKPKRAVRSDSKANSVIPPKESSTSTQTTLTDSSIKPEDKPQASNNETPVATKDSSSVPSRNNNTVPPGFTSKPPGFNGVNKEHPLNSEKLPLSVDTKSKPTLQRLGSLNLGSAGLHSPSMSPSPRTTEFFEQVSYPPNISRPKLPDGKFRYDRSFLLQFKEMCIEKPQEMKNLDVITNDDNLRQDSNDRNRGMHRRANTSGRIGLKGDQGDFSKPRTSEERFKLSTMQMRNEQGARGTLGRTSSGGLLPGMNHQLSHKDRTRSGRGGRGGKHGNQGGPTIPLDQVVPLEQSENRWVAKKPEDDDKLSIITRKTKSLLNKLTLEKFDSISDKIIELANESVNETDGFTLKTVIQLVFEKACDEPNFSALYAKLCQKMQTDLNPEIYDEEVRSKNNELTKGGSLFRKYILTRCQKEFEKGWKVEGMQELQDSDMMSDEYYKLAKAKRQGLGLIRFIGEVYKLQMLTENIMHYCIKRLLLEDPDDEEVESLSKLLTTIGKQLDTPKNKQAMNKYFEQIVILSKSQKLSSRIRFMLMDLIDLRKNKWQTGKTDTPKTLQQIKEDAHRESEEKAKQDKIRRSGSSGGKGLPPFNPPSRQNSNYDKERRTDGWNSVGSGSSLATPSSRTKTGDLSGFGNLSKSKTASNTSFSLGPTSVFNTLGPNSKAGSRDSASQSKRGNITNSNMFDMLADSEPKPSGRPILNLTPKSTVTAEPAPETPETPKTISPDLLERKVKTLVDEFLNSGDLKEAILTVKEFEEFNCYDEVVYKIISISIEKKKTEIEKVSKLLEEFSKDNIISTNDFLKGSQKMMEQLEDLATDVPFAFVYMAMFLSGLSLSLTQLIDLAQPLNEFPSPFPSGPKFFFAYIQERLSRNPDEDSIIKEFVDSKCDLTKLYHPDNRTAANLDKLCDESKIAFLVPSIKESDVWKELHAEN